MTGLDRVFRPRSVAVIGGGAWAANAVEECLRLGFTGAVWPVHPKRTEVGGLPAFPAIEALPEAPDVAFIAINREATIGAVSALAARGAGGAVCFASGFRESENEIEGGTDLQHRLLQAAGSMRIIGPNCYGFVNYLDRVAIWPDFHGGWPVESGVAIATQSSNLAINLTMQQRGLPIAYMATAGNQAQTGLSEIGMALLEDPRVTALGLYVEGIDDIRGFERMATTARKAGKAIVVMKIGRSDQAAGMAVSHTASLAGSDAGAAALLERLGIARVSTLTSLVETLKLLHVVGPLTSNRIACLSCSGGEANLTADLCDGRALTLPPLTDAQAQGLRAALGPKVALANPLDYHTYIWGNEDALTATFSAMMGPDLAFGWVVLDFPRGGEESDLWLQVLRAAKKTRDATGVPMGIVSTLPENIPEPIAISQVAEGIVPFCGMAEAIDALEAGAWLGRERPEPVPIALPGDGVAARTLSEADSKRSLQKYGLAAPRSCQAKSPEGAAAAASEMGFPVVLKGEGIAHKTEAGAVVLNLQSAAAVLDAAHAMPAESFLVEQMAPAGIELLAGVTCDPAHGLVLTLAAGGVMTEILEDSTNLLLPVTENEIDRALDRLKIGRLLRGYRGAPPVDRKAVIDALLALQAYVLDHAAIVVEAEINPLICHAQGAVAVDALIILGGDDDR